MTDHAGVGRTDKDHPMWVSFTPSGIRRAGVIVLLLVVGLFVGMWAFTALSSFLFILLLAWLVSIGMEPVVLFMTNRGMKRGLATGLTMLVLFLIFAGMAEVFGAVFYAQVSQLGQSLPTTVSSALSWVNSTFHTTLDVSSIQNALQLTPEKIGQLLSSYGGGLLGVFGSIGVLIFDGLTILVFAYYFSADSPRLRQTIGSWLPQRYQRVFVTVWKISVEKTGGYVVSKLVLAGLSAIFHIAFFWLINVPFWLPLGLLAGILSQFIPTIGTYIGVALPALFALVSSQPLNVLWIAVFATIYQQVENYIFTPRVSRRTMNVHPAIALGSVIAGAALFGPIGALIGIPIAAVALSIIDTFSQRHELLPELASLQPPVEEVDTKGKKDKNGTDLSETKDAPA
ncbi:AI-2E family transporter [Lapillicoccus sp.]|uniref:AI-2E family transporter n=1 Tax=Lapillicoccus sp. TaxID=1909287 RepID=UPI003265027B